MDGEIINKVAQSGIISIDLEELYPAGERILFDIAPLLVEGFMLREKDFREFVKQHDWSKYSGKYIALFCSTDAVIPTWAWMLLANSLAPYAKKVVKGDQEALESAIFNDVLNNLDLSLYKDQRVVIKGCADKPVPVNAYVQLTLLLTPLVKSVMFGEPCSTVPVYKRK
jgi:hypothetical protein